MMIKPKRKVTPSPSPTGVPKPVGLKTNTATTVAPESSVLAKLKNQLSNPGYSSSSVAGGAVYVGPKQNMGVRGGPSYTTDDTVSVTDKINEFYNWTDAQYAGFVNKLKSQNYISKTGKTDPGTVRDIWVSAVNEAATYYSATGGAKKMTVDGVLSLYSKSAPSTSTSAAPSRSIYNYSEDDVKTIIDKAYQNVAMRPATDSEIGLLLESTKKQLATGTLSTTKKVRNPKTGVLENVTTQTAGPTVGNVQASIEEQLKKANPDDYDRTKRIEFSDWLSKNTGV
jgi:hypothetical protein